MLNSVAHKSVTVKGYGLTQYQKYIFVQIMCSTYKLARNFQYTFSKHKN